MIKFILENLDTIFKNENSLETLNKVILDLAIRGKLVPQNENDEPASELLKKIQAEKERLIQEKVIKKEKSLPKITEEEIPFDIPKNWEWVRLGDISKYIQRGKSPEYSEIEEIPVVSQKCVQWTGLDITKVRYINPNSLDKYTEERFLQKNDLLWNSTGEGTLGRIAIYDKEVFKKVVVDSHVTIIRNLFVNNQYLLLYFSSGKVQNEINSKANGSTKQTELATSTIKEYLLPLPPLEEQKRIVEKVERLQKLIKNLKEIYSSDEKNRNNLKKSLLTEIENSNSDKELLNNLELVFNNFEKIVKTKEDIKDIRNLILSLAIKGKLVPQNENDEPASELLKKIQAEKERLIQEKVIKKEKSLPKITEEEIPFDIPKNWEYEKLGNLLTLVTKGATPTTYGFDYLDKGINFLKVENVKNGKVLLESIKTFISNEANEFQKRSQLKEGDILFSIAGTIGETCIIKKEYLPANTNQAFAILKGGNIVFILKFLKLLLNSLVLQQAKKLARGGAMNNISLDDIKQMLVLIPPLEEQKRIVEKVENLMEICNLLEEKIDISEKISENLLKSLVNNNEK